MHLALPPRKSSHPLHYPARSSRILSFRRSRLKYIVLCSLGIGAIVFLFSRLFGGDRISFATPPVVVVTVLQSATYSKQYISTIKENRNEYAKRHGYETFFPESNHYELDGSPRSWSKIPAMRHAMARWPHSRYFWLLDQNSLIMNPDLTIESIMDPKRMDTLMIRDRSIVPPDSVIKTFTHLHGDQIDLALTQDEDGLAPSSFIIRRGEWAKFFLDTWFDPLYRSYNFQKADTHALEHIVQWHPTILSKLALVPQRILNSYSNAVNITSTYKEGDFIIHFNGCQQGGERICEGEAEPFSKKWREIFNVER